MKYTIIVSHEGGEPLPEVPLKHDVKSTIKLIQYVMDRENRPALCAQDLGIDLRILGYSLNGFNVIVINPVIIDSSDESGVGNSFWVSVTGYNHQWRAVKKTIKGGHAANIVRCVNIMEGGKSE